jgi:hypothetical protein
MTRPLPTIAKHQRWAYASPVAANSAAEIGVSKPTGGHRLTSGFFVSAAWQPVMGGPCGGAFGHAGFCRPVRQPCTVPPTLIGVGESGENTATTGNTAMTPRHTLTLVTPTRRARAAHHRRLALAALKLDSSLSVRLSRYWRHIEQARLLERVAFKGGVK